MKSHSQLPAAQGLKKRQRARRRRRHPQSAHSVAEVVAEGQRENSKLTDAQKT
jgi:hypothetical protein